MKRIRTWSGRAGRLMLAALRLLASRPAHAYAPLLGKRRD